MISTLGTLLGAIESVVVVLAFQLSFYFHKHGSCISMTILQYAWLQNDIANIWISNGKTIYTYAENGVSYLFKR